MNQISGNRKFSKQNRQGKGNGKKPPHCKRSMTTKSNLAYMNLKFQNKIITGFEKLSPKYSQI